MKSLSNVLSEAILQALTDLELCRNDPQYVINFENWHEVKSIDGDQFSEYRKVCSVCFAGSVMAQSLKVPLDVDFTPSDFKDINITNMLHALDDIRQGCLGQALHRLSMPIDNLPEHVIVNEEDYSEFVSDVTKIVNLLKENNL